MNTLFLQNKLSVDCKNNSFFFLRFETHHGEYYVLGRRGNSFHRYEIQTLCEEVMAYTEHYGDGDEILYFILTPNLYQRHGVPLVYEGKDIEFHYSEMLKIFKGSINPFSEEKIDSYILFDYSVASYEYNQICEREYVDDVKREACFYIACHFT